MPLKRTSSAKLLEKALARSRGALTVADAAAKSGLPLREAEEGLQHLAAEFGGHLSATEKGEILYSFPRGLVRPPETRWLPRALAAVGRGVMAVGRFVVRAWVSVVLIGYALAFGALLIALSLKGDSDDGPGEAIGIVLRVVFEALYWTFHPFSPVYARWEPAYAEGSRRSRRKKKADDVPFYEKVNRFVFGPRAPERDPREDERNVLAELRRKKGRVVPADVMRVTGLPREAAERLLLRLVVDYQGEIEVADTGAIVYRFSDLRSTAREEAVEAPPAFWGSRSVLRPLTGNSTGMNVLFGLINGFNLAASSWVLAKGYTLERIAHVIGEWGERYPQPLPPVDGVPLVFGAIPFVFSAALFALPLARAWKRKSEVKRVGRENGWRGVLRLAVTGRQGSMVMTRDELAAAWVAAGGHAPTDDELTNAARAVGAEVDVGDEGQLLFRFDVLEGELRAGESARAGASPEEARPGEVVFSSEDEGPGMREEGRDIGEDKRGRAALPEAREVFPDELDKRQESQEELLARLGVDTRRRGG